MTLPISLYVFAQALGWTLVHSLWQIALIWLVFKALTWRLQRHNQAVYLLALAAMLASAVWATATFVSQHRLLSAEAEVASVEKILVSESAFETPAPDFSASEPASQSLLAIAQSSLERHIAPIGWAWLFCAAVLWLRLLGGWWLAQRLRRRGVSQPDVFFQNLCGDWARRLNIRRPVRLLDSSVVTEPLTLGFWKPVILFPAGMLAQLSPAQVEALLLHELAHIRRHDYLVNLFQLALEVCFFYHPLLWLLSREARDRREFCCDDVVLRHTSNPILYAKTLTDLQLSFAHAQNQFAMNATGKSHFTERILRIAGIAPKRSLRSNWLIFMFLPMFVTLCSWWSAAQTPPENERLAATETSVAAQPDITAATPFSQDSVPPRRRPGSFAQETPLPGPASAGDTIAPPPAPERISIVAMELTKMNVFYIGVDNPITVTAPGYDCASIFARLKGEGSIVGNGDCRYNVLVTTPGWAEVLIYLAQNGNERLLGSREFRVKRIPDPAGAQEPLPANGPIFSDLVDWELKKDKPQMQVANPGEVAIQAVKMNVFYIGIDNPLRIAAPGVPVEELSARLVGAGKLMGSGGDYNVVVTQPGEITIQVYRKQDGRETLLSEQRYRVKRIPDPTPKLGGKFSSRSITQETLLNAPGLEAALENFDFDAVCEVVGFSLTAVPRQSDPTTRSVIGSKFTAIERALFEKLGDGGAVFIDDIRVKCPGDAAPRNVGGLAFKIKNSE